MYSEQVVLVDQQDNVIGTSDKLRAHELGLLHRAFSIFIFNERNELLLQQRNANKYHCGGLWTNTCCSHPRLNEPIVSAGQRRLQEEMGFTVNLELLGQFIYCAKFNNGLIEYELDHVLVGRYNEHNITFDPQEVQAYKWVAVQELVADLQSNSALYTPWLGLALGIVQDKWGQIA